MKGEPGHVWYYDALAGGGAIRSNVTDMIKFLQAFMSRENIKDVALKYAMIDCQTVNFNADEEVRIGLGWHSEPFHFDRLFHHGGGTGGYNSFIGFTKEGQKGIVVLTNSETNTEGIALKILEALSSTGN